MNKVFLLQFITLADEPIIVVVNIKDAMADYPAAAESRSGLLLDLFKLPINGFSTQKGAQRKQFNNLGSLNWWESLCLSVV